MVDDGFPSDRRICGDVFLQTIRTVQDVPSLESRSNRMIFQDVSSNYPTTPHTNINSSCSKVVHAFGQRHFLQNLSEDKMEHIRKTMIKHEEMFKEQVKALHRLYNTQRSAMHEIRKHSFSPHNLSIFSTTAIHLHDDASKISDIKGKLHQVSPFKQAENHSISITRPRSPVRFILTDENIAKSSGQSSLWNGENKAINSAVKEKRARKTIDLERPPEEYLDDLDDFSENQEREMREAGNPDEVSVAPRNVLDTDEMLGGSEKVSSITQMEEQFSKQREWFRTDIGRHVERENLESVPLKRLKGSQDDTDLLPDLKDSIDQETSTPTIVQSTSGTVMFLEKEGKMDKKSSEWESNGMNHAQHDKKQKHQSFDLECKDKPSDINTKLPSWFPQATVTGSRNPENDSPSQMTSWMLAPVFSQPQGWNFVGSSEDPFIQGKGIFPFLTDIKMSGTMQDIDKKTSVNKEAQNCEENGSTQENLVRHPTESFQTILAPNPYGVPNQLTPLVFPTGYPVGAAIPAIGMQWSVEGHPALAAQGFVFPAVNKTSEMGPLPNPLSAAWCPQGAYFQLYPYQQQVLNNNKFSAPCHSADQSSKQGDGHIESHTPGKPISQAENETSLQAKTKRCHEESSSVNGSEGFPRPQHSSITSANPPFDRTAGCTLDSRDIQTSNHSERRISTTGNEPSKPFNTSEKQQINAKVSRCNNHSLDTQEVAGQQEEISKDCKSELRTTEQTQIRILVNESKRKDEDGSKSSSSDKGNYPLLEKRNISTSECSAGQAVSQDSKELQKIASEVCFSKALDIQKHAPDKNLQTSFKIQGMQTELSGLLNLEDTMSIDASHKMHWLSTDKSEICASRMGSQKETNKLEDLDSSGHGSNNLGTHEGKQCRGEDARQLDPIDTYTSICSESKIRESVEGQLQIETNGIHSRIQCVQIEEPEGALADDKGQFNKVHSQALTSNGHVKVQGSPRSELDDVKNEECPSGEKDMEDIQIDSLKHRDRIERLIDTQLNTQLSSTNQMLALQSDHLITDKMPSKDRSSEATETPKECNKLQENKGISEEEEEARENLAANILLSLVKDISERSSSVTKESVVHQQGRVACVGPSSSHSSRDSTCHRNERKTSTRRSKPRTHEAGVQGSTVGWTKSIRGKRRRTQRPRT
ncbi:uncharacterized protein LOC131040932 isoform X2 [Cryptomeria japonica]|uniref:uncharacterized protein LOC131040932 isoform X2 n=1 Tax=Cryptomeria japonica TaxID=3369 RepID=UPI0027D9F49A|nr:uncharacterized protein LOC131040932 isoform X2 [Cryptomeria japonica]